jgi:Rrf2 family protein
LFIKLNSGTNIQKYFTKGLKGLFVTTFFLLHLLHQLKLENQVFKKETEYALRALVYIQLQNSRGRRPGIAEIASEIETPQSFTAKILQRLVKQGFVESLKGINGGFFFNPAKEKLHLKKVIVSIEGDSLFSGCGFGLKHCDENNPCPLHFSYAPIREAINNLVSDESIQSLANKYTADNKMILSRLNITQRT